MAFVPAENIISTIRKRLGLDENIFIIMQIWERELGPLAGSVKLIAIKKNRLIVEVASSPHFQEMNIRKQGLINKINQYFGGEKVVKEIKLQLRKY